MNHIDIKQSPRDIKHDARVRSVWESAVTFSGTVRLKTSFGISTFASAEGAMEGSVPLSLSTTKNPTLSNCTVRGRTMPLSLHIYHWRRIYRTWKGVSGTGFHLKMDASTKPLGCTTWIITMNNSMISSCQITPRDMTKYLAGRIQRLLPLIVRNIFAAEEMGVHPSFDGHIQVSGYPLDAGFRL